MGRDGDDPLQRWHESDGAVLRECQVPLLIARDCGAMEGYTQGILYAALVDFERERECEPKDDISGEAVVRQTAC